MKLLTLLGLVALAKANPVVDTSAFCRLTGELTQAGATNEKFVNALAPLIRDLCESVGVQFSVDQYEAAVLGHKHRDPPHRNTYERCMRYVLTATELRRECQQIIAE